MTSPIRLTPKTSAQLIRTILKKAFPAAKFSVTTARGSMVSSVDVRWTDGPTVARVEELVSVFESGSFDSMRDSFDYNQGADRYLVIDGVTYERGVRYVHTSRKTSEALVRRCAAQVSAFFGLTDIPEVKVSGEAAYVNATAAQDQAARDRSGFDWNSLVHQAAGDATRFAR